MIDSSGAVESLLVPPCGCQVRFTHPGFRCPEATFALKVCVAHVHSVLYTPLEPGGSGYFAGGVARAAQQVHGSRAAETVGILFSLYT
jgi:hypothetical protein